MSISGVPGKLLTGAEEAVASGRSRRGVQNNLAEIFYDKQTQQMSMKYDTV